MKTIGHTITCLILIISWNPNISHSMTGTKTSLKGLNRQGTRKIEFFQVQNFHDNSLGGDTFYQCCGIIVCSSDN